MEQTATCRTEQPAALGTVTLLLFVSGACALVFQVVWMRELRLVFGATTGASAAVLAVFMGGLGLGNAVLGRRIDRSFRPVHFYGLLEAGIAGSVAISPLLIDVAQSAYIAAGGQAVLGVGTATAVRLAATAVILGVPTFLMGGTLPAAARAVSVEADVHRSGVALVYGLNTLGAVGGAGLANFLLLERLGSRETLWAACVLNLLLAAAALAMSRRLCRLPVPKTRRGQLSPERFDDALGPARLVYLAAGVVGFAFFLMELVWYRMLGPLLGGTTYTFGLILCIALLGIGVGGACYSLFARRLRPTLQLFGLTCAVEAAAIAIPFWTGDRIALWVLRQQAVTFAAFSEQIWVWFKIGSFVILPAALVAGFQFPLLIGIAGRGRRDIGRHVGWIFAANTLGAIAGSLAGGFILLPVLTAPGAWQAVVWMLVGLAALIAGACRPWKSPLVVTSAAAALLAVTGVLQQGPTAAWRHSGIGAGRAQIEGNDRNAEQEFLNSRRRELLWEADGIESCVGITATDSLTFVVNGKSDGNAIGDAGTQVGLGLMGPLLSESIQTGLVIGLGTGETAGWLADVENVTAVDVVELEPVIAEIARRCAPVNRDVLNNRKVQLYFNDAREFLLTARKRYDVIVSEPSNPYRAGVANLYTQEFYRSVAQRLSSNGLFLQWLQGYEVDADTVRIVLKTLRSVFPVVEVWRTKTRDLLLVCGQSPEALAYDAASLRRQLEQPVIRDGLMSVWRVADVEGVLAHYVCGPPTIDAHLSNVPVPLNTDDRNLLEYAFAKSVGKRDLFSTESLQAEALELGDNGPVAAEDVTLATVVDRRSAMHLLLGDSVPIEQNWSHEQQVKAAAYNEYAAGRYQAAAARFQEVGIDAACPIETIVYAQTLAEMGQPVPEDILRTVSGRSELEASAVKAILAWRTGAHEQAVPPLFRAFELLRSDPWAMPSIIDSITRIAIELAERNQQAASLLYERTASPFVMYRMNESRLALKYLSGERLGGERFVEVLESFEPHVLWTEWFLESRARTYAQADHPLFDAAMRDLQHYQAWSVGQR